MRQKRGKVFLNFLPVRAGGGLQNSLSFLTMLIDDNEIKLNSTVFCWQGSRIEDFCKKNNLEHHSISNGKLNRLYFELVTVGSLVSSGDVIFTLFGPPLLRCCGAVSINGCAYSNLFYPELDFWGFLPFHKKFIKLAIDVYRKRMLSRSDIVIFETESLLKRGKLDGLFVDKDLRLVEMTPSSLVDINRVTEDISAAFELKLNNDGEFDILYLSGAHENKRHLLFSEILKELHVLGLKSRLITTLPSGNYLRLLEKEFDKHGVGDLLVNVGPVSPSEVPSLISVVDAMCNIALLESFSNNYVEAWNMKKPLIVASADWSYGCCNKGALYIEPERAKSSAEKIYNIKKSRKDLVSLIASGDEQLKKLPSRQERFQMYKSIIVEHLQ